jgi:hypothetical protein
VRLGAAQCRPRLPSLKSFRKSGIGVSPGGAGLGGGGIFGGLGVHGGSGTLKGRFRSRGAFCLRLLDMVTSVQGT